MRKASLAMTGDKDLVRTLRKLGRGPGTAAQSVALQTAMKPIRDEAKLRVARNGSVRSGDELPKNDKRADQLVRNIVVRRRPGARGTVRVWVAIRGKRRSVAHLVEFGTAPHYQPGRGIMHPGARAKPFLRPAFEDKKHEVIQTFGEEIWREIEKQVIRLAMRSGTRRARR